MTRMSCQVRLRRVAAACVLPYLSGLDEGARVVARLVEVADGARRVQHRLVRTRQLTRSHHQMTHTTRQQTKALAPPQEQEDLGAYRNMA
jgi:hypothetical protein